MELVRSLWEQAQRGGAVGHRIPVVVGLALNVIALIDAAINGHTSALWWVFGGLTCILVAFVWAYHDLRLDYVRAIGAARYTLVDWLEERIVEVRNLQAKVAELLAHPGGINRERFDERESIEQVFWDINREVVRRLRREAPESVEHYDRNPEWYYPYITQGGEAAFTDLIRLMGFTLDQLAYVKKQVS